MSCWVNLLRFEPAGCCLPSLCHGSIWLNQAGRGFALRPPPPILKEEGQRRELASVCPRLFGL
eukprot:7948594-Pyramimonas_sp.AAC.1